jgi:catechol 2,3-dioxygenase-like lactoylglutathione lyase family enzyme
MIQHVTRQIQPSKLDECVRFYGLLGFVRIPVPASLADRVVWLEHSETQIHLMTSDDSTPEQGHVGIVVETYDRTVDRLRREGHEVQPRRAHWGAPRSYVHDPAGNLVELMAWAPGSQELRPLDGER